MNYIGFDVGGTKIRGYQVIPTFVDGKLVDAKLGENVFDVPELKSYEYHSSKNLNSLIEKGLRKFGKPKDVVIGASIAGVINQETLDFSCANVHFPITFLGNLREDGYQTFVVNDLFAAGTALSRLGPGKEYSRVAIQNIGSGNNTALAVNGKVISVGRESGHTPYIDGGISCGCGGIGHLEAYASGNGAATMALTHFRNHPNDRDHLILEEALKDWNLEKGHKYTQKKLEDDDFFFKLAFFIQGKHVMNAYKRDKELAKVEDRKIGNPHRQIRRIQRNAIAYQLGQITGIDRPELIIIRGSFITENWRDLGRPSINRFLGDYERFVHTAIKQPVIDRKRVKKDGVIGAVLCAIDELEQK
jgi:hypothetical protein